MEGSWEGIAGCVVHVDVHGECVCCGWMQYSCSRRDVLLFMVTKYPFFQPNALLEKSGRFDCSSLKHTQHAQNTAVYALHDEDCRISSRNVSFFPIKHLVG